MFKFPIFDVVNLIFRSFRSFRLFALTILDTPEKEISHQKEIVEPRTRKPKEELLGSYSCLIYFSPPTNATLTCGHICCGACLLLLSKPRCSERARWWHQKEPFLGRFLNSDSDGSLLKYSLYLWAGTLKYSGGKLVPSWPYVLILIMVRPWCLPLWLSSALGIDLMWLLGCRVFRCRRWVCSPSLSGAHLYYRCPFCGGSAHGFKQVNFL